MLRICKDGKKKYQSLGISVLPRYWNFTRNKPKPNCPNKEYIQKIILDKQTELQQRMLEFNSEQKEYTTTTLLNDENKRFELKTVCQYAPFPIRTYWHQKRTRKPPAISTRWIHEKGATRPFQTPKGKSKRKKASRCAKRFFLVSPICCFAAGVTPSQGVKFSRNVKSSAEP